VIYDVAIVGGGMVGASLALGLAGTGREVLLIEGIAPGSASQPSFDERTTALGNASRRIFDALGVWHALSREASPIRTIHVSDAGRFGFARLNAAEQGIDAFGYVVPNRVIGAGLWLKLGSAPGVTLRMPARTHSVKITEDHVELSISGGKSEAVEEIRARLVVAADGAHSSVRTAAGIGAGVEDYNQVAIVTTVTVDRPHAGTAFERFTPSGPLAVLPLHDGSMSVIWTVAPERAVEILALSDGAFLDALQSRFGWRAGRFLHVGRRASYPLQLTRANSPIARRAVLIGNAAQALHPVAGQGFNLGLRDAAMLAELVASASGDPGAPGLLERFAGWRAADRGGVIRFTDGLVRLFGDARPGVGLARDFGLLLFDLTPPAKSALARVSAGFAGPTPRLARGLAVR
jgi:2-octaprenyl-6-methoxyphenol hydroxylase